MKKKFLLFSVLGGLSVCVLSSSHSGVGISQGYDCTGAETGLGNSAGCSCHGGSATSTVIVNIALDSAGVPTTHYKAGMTYNVVLTSTNSLSLSKFGFQLGCITGTAAVTTPTNAGTFDTTGLPTSTRYTAASSGNFVLNMIEQSNTITGSAGTFVDSFSWTAPAAGTGAVSFWAVVNAVNGNGGTSGDKWNTNSAAINEWVIPTSVANVANSTDVKVFPVPFNDVLNVSFAGVDAGDYTVSVFDLSGAIRHIQVVNVTGATYQVAVPVSELAHGVYQVVIAGENFRKVVSAVK
jgi:Secretion system C-terminal sorting domain/Reeler domain